MKKYRLLFTLAAALLLLSGCARQQGQMSYIGAEAAKQLALEDSGVPSAEAQSLIADLDTRNGQDYYQVSFTASGESYQYAIDALTGVIIEAQKPGAAAQPPAGDLQTPAGDLQTPAAAPEGSLVTDADTFNSESPAPAGTDALPAAGSDGGAAASGGLITKEQAKVSALTHAGLTADQVSFVKTKLDYEDGRQVYEVEFYTADYKEYDYEIDAYTGEVVSYDYDAEGYTPPPSGNTITAEEAKAVALAQVPGATVNDIWEFELDYDDGRAEYEGKILYNGMEYEFEIDGYSGAIRSWEAEPR